MSRQQVIAAHIARAIMRNTQKRFGTLYADALEETKMSNSNDVNEQSGSPRSSRNPEINSGINGTQNSELRPVSVTPVNHTNVSDTFSTDAFRNQPGPRGETTDTPEAGA